MKALMPDRIFMKNYTHIIWDFNGTILDDIQIGIDSINCLLRKRGISPIESTEHYRSLFGFPIIDYYKRLGFDFDSESYDDVAVEWVEQYNSRRRKATVHGDVKRLLDKFKEENIKQLIISATERNMLSEQIDELGLSKYFDEILGIDDIKATSKTHVAVEWREEHPDAIPLFIGDTDHDMDTARAMGAECALVACGHQSYDYLNTLGCTVYRNMDDLYRDLFGN